MKNEKNAIVAAGLVIGVISALLVFFGNPVNMGFCIACFLRDTAGALGFHSAPVVQYIRPEIIGLAKKNSEYWMRKYNPLVGDIQDRIYDLYLKGNKIESGRKNYSEVIGLLISYEEWKNKANRATKVQK